MIQRVLMMDTDNPAAHAAAQTLQREGAHVWFARTAPASAPLPGVRYLVFDPYDSTALQQAVDTFAAAEGALDLFVFGAPQPWAEGPGYDAAPVVDALMQHVYGTRLVLEAFLPLLRLGARRVGHITCLESSNSYSTQGGDIARHTALAAQNMLGRMFFNRLRPEGFTFRWYCDDGLPGGMEAAQYFNAALCYDPKEPYTHSDENRMVLRDAYLREIPW